MQTANETNAIEFQQDRGVVDVIFGALGIDDSFLEEEESKPTLPDSTEDTQQMPWVLHVDDDRDLSAAMATRFEFHGIKVLRVFDGTGGVRTALSHQASAIILDYEMPNGQGDYVLGRLKDNPITRDIPVIILTGRKDRFLERKLLGMGAVRFLNKPVDFKELLGELRQYIDLPEKK